AGLVVRQVRQFHRLADAVDDQGGTRPGAQTGREQSSAPITAQRLHRRIVDGFDRTTERLPEIEADPAAAEVMRLAQRAAVENRAGITNRYRVIFPAGRRLSNFIDHFLRGHIRAGRNFEVSLVAGGQHLHVRATNIDDQNLEPFFVHSRSGNQVDFLLAALRNPFRPGFRISDLITDPGASRASRCGSNSSTMASNAATVRPPRKRRRTLPCGSIRTFVGSSPPLNRRPISFLGSSRTGYWIPFSLTNWRTFARTSAGSNLDSSSQCPSSVWDHKI